HDVAAVRLDGNLADAELETDLLVEEACNHQRHDFLLARAERCMPLAQHLQLHCVMDRKAAALDRITYGIQEGFIAEGLCKELDSSSLHGLDAGRHVAIARDEDDRHLWPIRSDVLLKIETVEVGERKVENQAAWRHDARLRQKLLGGRESPDLPTHTADQRLQRLAHRDVVIDDEHDGARLWHG